MKKVIIYIMCMCIIGFVCSCGSKETETESELEVSENVSETDDNNKEYVIPDIIGDFSDGLACIIKDGKYGYINKKGEIVIPIEFEIDPESQEIHSYMNKSVLFYDGLAYIYKNGKYGWIDKNGNEVIPCIYNSGWKFSDGLTWVNKEKDEKWSCIDKAGKELMHCIYDYAYDFSDGLAWVCKDKDEKKWGCIDTNGNEVIPFMYADVTNFSEGMAWVCKEENGKWGGIDKYGNEVIPFIYSKGYSFNEGLAVVNLHDKSGVIDKKGNTIVPFEYDSAREKFSDGYIIMRKKYNGDNIIIDKKGNIIGTWDGELPDGFSEGLCVFRDRDTEKYGYIDENLNIKIPADYDYTTKFSEGLALVEKGEERYYIDKNGNIALDKFFYNKNEVETTNSVVNETVGRLKSTNNVWQCFSGNKEIPEYELIIESIDNQEVIFSLLAYRIDSFTDKHGTINNDGTISFNSISGNIDGAMLSGIIAVNDESVVLTVTDSSHPYIEKGQRMFFTNQTAESILQ